MSRLELFGQGLVGGLMIFLFIEYFAGYLHINKAEANRYKKKRRRVVLLTSFRTAC